MIVNFIMAVIGKGCRWSGGIGVTFNVKNRIVVEGVNDTNYVWIKSGVSTSY